MSHLGTAATPQDASPPRSARLLGPAFESLSDRRVHQLTWALIALGIAARLVRYALRFPLWQDEAYLAASFLDRDFVGLMGPLENRQVAPLLFLWAQWSVLRLLGFSEYTLRLVPLISGIGSLLLLRHVAGRLLRGTALVLAVGFFAVAYPAIRYSVEAKQYSSDVLASLVVLALAVEWWRRPEQVRWLWALAAAVPLAVGFSYPALFTAGGIGLAVGAMLIRRGTPQAWLAWLCYGVVLAAGFWALMALSAGSQSSASREFLVKLWPETFPPLSEPLRLVGWFFVTHTSDMVSYPIGGARGGGTLTFLCCVAGLLVLYRRGRLDLALLLLSPLAVNFAAACLKRYPYGGPVRFSIYAAPLVCLVAGLGAAAMLPGFRPQRWHMKIRMLILVPLLMALAAGSIVRDLMKPYKNREVLRIRQVARSLWQDRAVDEEVVCLWTDLGDDFSRKEVPAARALYLCNQRIYSARIAAGEPPQWDRISQGRPLCCVQHRSPGCQQEGDRLALWLGRMKSRYDLVGEEEFVTPLTFDAHPVGQSVHLFRFVPRGELMATEKSRPPPPGTVSR